MNKPMPPTRDAFKTFITIPTRWSDNDLYGHVNNVAYYSYFDTAVNQWLLENGLLELYSINELKPIGLVVANRCQYFSPLAFPQVLEIGLKINHIGTSSVCYQLGVFAANADLAAAAGEFTHVYVQRSTRKSMPLPESWRTKLSTLTT